MEVNDRIIKSVNSKILTITERDLFLEFEVGYTGQG